MLHGGGLEKASPARTIETHSPPGIEKTLNNMLREKSFQLAGSWVPKAQGLARPSPDNFFPSTYC